MLYAAVVTEFSWFLAVPFSWSAPLGWSEVPLAVDVLPSSKLGVDVEGGGTELSVLVAGTGTVFYPLSVKL